MIWASCKTKSYLILCQDGNQDEAGWRINSEKKINVDDTSMWLDTFPLNLHKQRKQKLFA